MHHNVRLHLLLAAAICGVFAGALLSGVRGLAAGVPGSTTERVSVSTQGDQGDFESYDPSISASGRFVAFTSKSANLVPGDTNGEGFDVFVRDTLTGQTERVSISSAGGQTNVGSLSVDPSISADGSVVVFVSNAANLVAEDLNGAFGVFLHNRVTHTTELLGKINGNIGDFLYGYASISISAGGDYVAFSSLPPDGTVQEGYPYELYLHDRNTGQAELISIAYDGPMTNGHSMRSSISADGRYVVFESWANNLIEDDHNTGSDIFVRDRQADTTRRINMAHDGGEATFFSFSPFITPNGRYVTYSSLDDNLVAEDANEHIDVFLYDMQTGHTELVSLSPSGEQGDKHSGESTLSADGRFVVFCSESTNMGDPASDEMVMHVYKRDLLLGITSRVSVSTAGEPANLGYSCRPGISANGKVITFESDATNLVEGDTNGVNDIFTRTLPPPIFLPVVQR